MTPRIAPLLCGLVIAAPSLGLAEPFWLSEPGYCDADYAVIEDADVIYLTANGINSHWFGCQWPSPARRALLRGDQNILTSADCSNATTTWEADFDIVRQPDGALRVHQETGGISPVTFYHCPGD